jgi:hypothetical protein
MNLQAVVSNARSFSELLPIAQRAEPHLSFWGSCYITVAGYEGSIDIDGLASRTLQLMRQFNHDFSIREHTAGKRLAARIDRIYDKHIEQIEDAHCFTRILFALWNWPCAIFNYLVYKDRGVLMNWRGQEQSNHYFNYYSRTQFQSAFHMSPEEAERRGYVESCTTWPYWAGPPDIWHLKRRPPSPNEPAQPFVTINRFVSSAGNSEPIPITPTQTLATSSQPERYAWDSETVYASFP